MDPDEIADTYMFKADYEMMEDRCAIDPGPNFFSP